ncbi:hypothetical protein BDV06DRAFT_225123 [Aspergillus oleicola]
MPIPMLLKLHLRTKKKVYFLLMFSVGIDITVISIVRFSGLIIYTTSPNIIYNNNMVATYSVIDCNASIMCCCMPALLLCLQRAFPDFFDSTDRSLQYNSTPFQDNAIRKTVTHSIAYVPRDKEDDVLELVERQKVLGPEWTKHM